MAYTDINSKDRLVQKTFAEHLEHVLGWESVYAWNEETFDPDGTMARADTREVVLTRDFGSQITSNRQAIRGGITLKIANHQSTIRRTEPAKCEQLAPLL